MAAIREGRLVAFASQLLRISVDQGCGDCVRMGINPGEAGRGG
jgi:hypothetical protein